VNDDIGLFVRFAVIYDFLPLAIAYTRREYVSMGNSTETIEIVLRTFVANDLVNYFVGKFEFLFKGERFEDHRPRRFAFSS
jgi:hypothetical protein